MAEKVVHFVLICEEGYLSLTHRHENAYNLIEDSYSSETQVIAPLLIHQAITRTHVATQFFDYSCLYSLELVSAASFLDDLCSKIVNRGNPTSSYPLLNTYGIEDEKTLAAVSDWNEKIMKQPMEVLDITFDDEISKLLFGENSTKYVNLAGNVFKRETTKESDLDIISAFINRGIPSFRATFAYVVTWYKIGTTEDARLFNSFQCVITCGAASCFILYDIYEIQWGETSFSSRIHFKGN